MVTTPADLSASDILQAIDEAREQIKTIGIELGELEDCKRCGQYVDPETGRSVDHMITEVEHDLQAKRTRIVALANELRRAANERGRDPDFQFHRDSVTSQCHQAAEHMSRTARDRDTKRGDIERLTRELAERDGDNRQWFDEQITDERRELAELKRIHDDAIDQYARHDERRRNLLLNSMGLPTESVITVQPTGEIPVVVRDYEVLRIVCHPGRATGIPACLERSARQLIETGELVKINPKK